MTLPRLGVWPPLPLGVYLRRAASELPFPLRDGNHVLFARARHGLAATAPALGLRPGAEVLAPAYHHGSEIEALAPADLGSRFYEGRERLEPDDGDLESLLRPSVRALYLVHYLGFPNDARRWRAWCDARGLLLVEDAAQAWLACDGGEPVGALGDLSLFCLYKTYGLPDGAALVTRRSLSLAKNRPPLGLGSLARRHALWLAGRSGWVARASARSTKPAAYDPAADFALGDAKSAPSAATLFLLPRLADGDAAERRRANYRLLLEGLGELVAAAFAELPEGASPFAFPVEVDDKAKLLERLRSRGVDALDFWSAPHPSLPVASFPRARARRERTVALPVHQELRPQDVERIVQAVRGRGLPRQALRLEPVTDLEALRRDWLELAERSGNVFGTWEWGSLWWRHFGGDRSLEVTACRSRGGALVAVLPLYLFAARPLRVLRFLGHGTGDQLGPVYAPGDGPATARALQQLLRTLAWDVLIGEQLPRGEAWSGRLGARVLSRVGSPVLRFEGRTWDDLLAGKSRNFREQVRRRERKLAREHEVRYRLTDDRRHLDRDLDTLFALHAARWPDGGSGFGGANESFHREFAACALERGWLRLWSLEVDGKPAAAWYGFRFGGAECYYQAGRDPAWEPHSVGSVLLAHTIRAALEDGVREYRFLRGGEDYKYRFAETDPGLETIGLARGALGRAGLAAASRRSWRTALAR